MTTIFWDGVRKLVADRQESGSIKSMTTKIHQVGNGFVLAGCGDMVDIQAVVDWVKGGEEGKPPRVSDCEFFVLDTINGVCYYMDNRLVKIKRYERDAIGSGGRFALGAFAAGKSPEDSVRIACELDPHSGKGIEVLELDNPTTTKRRKK